MSDFDTFDAISYTNPGGRAVNEDSVLIIRSNGQFAAVVADGLGAYGGGDIASSAATAAVSNSLPPTGITDETVLHNCLEAANIAVLNRQKPSVPMKSTVVILTAENGQAAFAHAGDSRGYFFRNNCVICRTIDHSLSQMAVQQGDITPAQIRFHAGRNTLLRALGVDYKAYGEITALPPLLTGDAFLLCSDGFWEYVTEIEMESNLTVAISTSDWLERMLKRIKKSAPEGNDNLSAVAVIYGGKILKPLTFPKTQPQTQIKHC